MRERRWEHDGARKQMPPNQTLEPTATGPVSSQGFGSGAVTPAAGAAVAPSLPLGADNACFRVAVAQLGR